MRLVVDYESFVGNEGEHLIKELSIISVDGLNLLAHFLVKPPYAWSTLTRETQEYNNSVTKLTGIQWSEGSLDYSELGLQLVKCISKATTLYATSKAKANVLEQLTGRGFISAEDFSPPQKHSLKNLLACLHPSHSVENMRCSLKNVSMISQYIKFVDGQHEFRDVVPGD